MLTLPTEPHWTPLLLAKEVWEMVFQEKRKNGRKGPWVLAFGRAWAPYLDCDYELFPGRHTLKSRLEELPTVAAVTTDQNEDIPSYYFSLEERRLTT